MDIVSLYDYFGLTLEPWARAGYPCFAYDLKHKDEAQKNGIVFRHWDAANDHDIDTVIANHPSCYMLCAFPPCTDLAISGTRHWADKAMIDPHFQRRAMDLVNIASYLGSHLAKVWWLENPIGAIPQFWRQPNFYFEPYEYGGYLPEHSYHPLFPRRIPPNDAYTKKTGIWCSESFIIPPKKPVEPIRVGKGWSPQQQELGGKGELTKEIRSATPRGFAEAVFLYNQPAERGNFPVENRPI